MSARWDWDVQGLTTHLTLCSSFTVHSCASVSAIRGRPSHTKPLDWCVPSNRYLALQVDAFRDVLNNTSNEVRMLQQHVEEQKGEVLVKKG